MSAIDFHQREAQSYSPVHVINIDITDNAEEATLGAFQICDLCERVSRRQRFCFTVCISTRTIK